MVIIHHQDLCSKIYNLFYCQCCRKWLDFYSWCGLETSPPNSQPSLDMSIAKNSDAEHDTRITNRLTFNCV